MNRFSLRPRFHDDETVPSYLSRLASANGFTTIAALCGFVGVRKVDVTAARKDAVEQIACLGDVDPSIFSQNSIAVLGSQRFGLRGEILNQNDLIAKDYRVCPQCIQGDLDRPAWLKPEERIYERIGWRISRFPGCLIHGRTFISTPLPARRGDANHTHIMVEWLKSGKAKNETRPVPFSRRQSYLRDRLFDGARSSNDLLDPMPWYAVARLCELVGHSDLWPGQTKRDTGALSDPDQKIADRGFEILEGGTAGFQSWFDGLIEEARRDPARMFGFESILGALGKALYVSTDPAFDAVKDVATEIAFAKLPLTNGGHFFHRRPTHRLVQSIASASKEVGIPAPGLRLYLERVGIITPDTRNLTADKVTFPADRLPTREKLLETSMRGRDWVADGPKLGLKGAADYLGLSQNVVRPLSSLEATSGRQPGDRRVYDRHKLDDLRERLLEGCEMIEQAGPDHLGIDELARKRHLSLSTLVELHDTGRIRWKGCIAGADDLSGVVFRRGDFEGSSHLGEEDEITLAAAAKRFKLDRRIVYRLVEDGHLAERTVNNPVAGRKSRLVRISDCEKLMAGIVYLTEAACIIGVTRGKAGKTLREAGVNPIFEIAKSSGKVYWREEVERHRGNEAQQD